MHIKLGRELLKRLRTRFLILFPTTIKDLKPWAIGKGARMFSAC